jgi:DNA processing protein
MGSVSDDVLTARAFLNRVAEPTCIPLWIAVRSEGPVAVAQSIRDGTAHPDVARACAARLCEVDPYADLEAAHRRGIRLVVPESDEWPHYALSALEAAGERRAALWLAGQRTISTSGELIPPLALWARGPADLSSVGVRSVGIVGSRASTTYGEYVAAELSAGLAIRGFLVVSGGAYGIDAVAHRAALRADAGTVIVSAGGLDRPYPPSNSSLFDRAADTGLLLSESPPGAAPHRRRFLTRNRLIAALSTGTVVVEAAIRSGAMNTAGHCAGLGRPVMAVPGPVTSVMSAGCHKLLRAERNPALLVTCVPDVLDVIGNSSDISLPDRPCGDATAADVRNELDRLEPVARQVFDALPARRSATIEELAVTAACPPLAVLRALPALELAGLVEPVDGRYRISALVRGRLRARRSGPRSGATRPTSQHSAALRADEQGGDVGV